MLCGAGTPFDSAHGGPRPRGFDVGASIFARPQSCSRDRAASGHVFSSATSPILSSPLISPISPNPFIPEG